MTNDFETENEKGALPFHRAVWMVADLTAEQNTAQAIRIMKGFLNPTRHFSAFL
jgi:hypothetical protein